MECATTALFARKVHTAVEVVMYPTVADLTRSEMVCFAIRDAELDSTPLDAAYALLTV